MATQLILIIGAILLACGSAGLLIVRLTNPRLIGLDWLGGSFAAGSGGAMLLFIQQRGSLFLSALLADVLILLSIVLLHVAILELTDKDSLFPTLGIVLLSLQAAADFFVIWLHGTNGVRTCVIGLLIAAQAGQTVVALLRAPRHGIRAPIWFSATVLTCFMIFNFFRSLAIAFGVLSDPKLFYEVKIVTYVLFLAVALGIAFGFFWMTATILTSNLEQIASTDPLTRVYNRRVFLEWCEKEMVRSQQTGNTFSILMIDLDHFKEINDSLGHRAGDEVLCAVVEKVQDSVRGIDVLGRWGGEEFTVLLPHSSSEAAMLVGQRVRGNIEQIALQEIGSDNLQKEYGIKVTASVGVATFRGKEDRVSEVLHRADMALYEAKAAGRNRVLVTS
jgi:diguanylate cyclase (GGDEF)-like protein